MVSCGTCSSGYRWLFLPALALVAAGLITQSRAADAASPTAEAEEQLSPAAQEQLRLLKSIQWQNGPCTAQIGSMAEIKVPAGYKYTGPQGTRTWAEITGNPPSDSELGLLMPSDKFDWFLLFSFSPDGYIKDDDHDKLDANAILETLRAGNEEGNKYRTSKGLPRLDIVGWAQPPSYDTATHNLCWAIRASSQGSDVINYNTRVLGRSGVMSVNLVADPEDLAALIPTTKGLITNMQYEAGNRYAEWRPGDKVAAYGLSALVAGGAAAVAVKSGLFAKLAIVFAKAGKAIVIGILALLGAIGKLFTGRRAKT